MLICADLHAESVAQLIIKASTGDSIAQCSLGCAYQKGKGVDQNLTEAVKWFRKSAELENVYGQFNLAVSYATHVCPSPYHLHSLINAIITKL